VGLGPRAVVSLLRGSNPFSKRDMEVSSGREIAVSPQIRKREKVRRDEEGCAASLRRSHRSKVLGVS